MEMENKEFGCCLFEKILVWLPIEKNLVWLPVVSLLRFKAVCKTWRDLIQSPFFIDLHTTANITTLNSSTSSSSKFGSFIVHANNSDTLLMLSSPSYDSESSGGGGGGSVDDDQEGPVPVPVLVVDDLGFAMDSKAIVGSCNGLVCVCNREKRGPPKPYEVSLWNPATGQISVLPESKTIHPDGSSRSSLFVFGFDVETKDYKVVQFTSLKQRCNDENGSMFCFCRVQVYSLSTDSWRLLEGIPCLPGYPFQMRDHVQYLNGTGFFLAHHFYTKSHPCLLELNDRFIISFDFTKEIIIPIQLPDHRRAQELCLCSLGDKIALFATTKPEYDAPISNCQDFSIWVLNYERGSSSSSVTKESWTKLYSFQLQLECLLDTEWYKPKGISNNGKFAFIQRFGHGYKKMDLYNFATKEVKSDFLFRRTLMSKAHAYKLSLVSVIGGNIAGEMVQGAAAAAAAADMVID